MTRPTKTMFLNSDSQVLIISKYSYMSPEKGEGRGKEMSRLREKTTATLLIAMFMVSFFVVAIPISASPGVLHVGVGQTYETIQAAIDAASPDDTILVHPGTYTADGRVADICKSGLTLKSTDGPEVTIIQSGGKKWCYGAIRIRGADGDIPTTGVTIDGFTVYNTGTWHHGIGILVGFWGNAPAHSNIIRNCIIGSAENSELSPSYSIYLGYTSDNLIESNKIYQARDEGGVEGIGIMLWVHTSYYTSNTDNTLRDNTILDSDRYGICVGAWGAQVDVSGTVISDNTISGSGIAGIGFMYATGSITASPYNNIAGNTAGVWAYLSDTVDATLNWWGHASGPSGPDGRTNKSGKVIGKGDAVIGDVDWDPWLPQPVGHTPHDPVPPGLD